jgi:hypothetical protein
VKRLEFAHVAAFRLGWPVNLIGVMVTVETAAVFLPIRYFTFRETLSLVNLTGIAVCAAGLWRVSLRSGATSSSSTDRDRP